jgi:hypothetical protein
MVEEIICKVWNTKYNIGLLPNGNYIGKVDGKIKPVKKEVFAGSIHYRCVGSDVRVSKIRLNDVKNIVYNYTIQKFCPF